MGKLTLKDMLKQFIGHIGWKLFCWNYPGGEQQYLDDVYITAVREHEANQ